MINLVFPGGSVVKNPAANAGDGFDPWVRNIFWRKEWPPTPLFLPEKSHGQRSLAGYGPWGHKRVRHNLVTKQQQEWLALFVCICSIPQETHLVFKQ